MKIRLRYFARLREVFGRAGEEFEMPACDVTELLRRLRARGGGWALELADGRAFRVAVNQDIAGPGTGLAERDEVAIFPPVTGG